MANNIDRRKLESVLSKYVQKIHIGTLEKYTFEEIQKAEWFDKANEEIKVHFKTRKSTVAPTIGAPPVFFYSETVIVGGYMAVRPHHLSYSGNLNNDYPDWMK